MTKTKKTNDRYRVDIATIVNKIRSNQMRKNRIIRNSFVLFVIKKTYFFKLF